MLTVGSDGKESACNVGDLDSTPGLGKCPGGGHGNPLQYSCLENPHGQRSLARYSPWGHKESDRTEQPSTAQHEPPSDTRQDCLGAFHTHLRRVIMTLNKVHKPWFVPTVLYSTHSHPTNGILPFLCKINFSLLFNSLPV